MKTIIVCLSVWLGAQATLAQQSVQDLKAHLLALRSNPTLLLPKSVLNDAQNESLLMSTIAPYIADSLEVIRGKAYSIISTIGQKSNASAVRQLSVGYLVQGIGDKSTGISGSTSDALASFKKADFNNSARTALADRLNEQTAHLSQVVKLAGYIDETGYAEKISSILSTTNSKKNKWACRLALARMGDAAAIQYVVNRLSSASVNDDFMYDVLPDLLYTRNREVFRFIESIVQSDAYQCEPADPDASQKILCAYRAMEYMAPYIDGFPLRIDQSGTIEEKDYPQALQKLRKWLTANKEYKIKSDSY